MKKMKSKSENKPISSDFLKTDKGKTQSNAIDIPSIALPSGGGALKSIDEKFSINAVNGTASFSVPLPFSPARGASPALQLSYDSGAGNNVFGLGWNLSSSSIIRKTAKGLPRYIDAIDSDTYIFSAADDLVPEFKKEVDGSFSLDTGGDYIILEKDSPDGSCTIRFYKPRIEGLFARIERWTQKTTGIIKWRIITKENSTTLYGWTDNAVIADPQDATRIFEWLPEFTFDDQGNCCHYVYKKEDDTGFDVSLPHDKNRFKSGKITYTNRYIEKILYGNKTPYKRTQLNFPPASDYIFETIFDYGEYDSHSPYAKIKEWGFRKDAFSDYKPGFEVRTTRLCRRVLFFHHFRELSGGSALVRSMDLGYDTSFANGFSFLQSITVCGYIKKENGSYTNKKFPTIEFEYQRHEWNRDVRSITGDALIHAPAGIDENSYQFTDLFNEGLSGILSEQANGWYYKHNLGEGKFEQAKLVTPKPSVVGLGKSLRLADLNGDGGKQLISFHPELSGYFELNDDNDWEPFRNFQNLPNIDFSDAYTRMIDLDGDGRAEILFTQDNVYTWYQSDGKKGFSKMYQSARSSDDEAGPSAIFADSKQTIFLADMSGDGLSDIVRIQNGEVCYWPNLGYGKFGSRIVIDNAPLFDHPDSFDPSFLRLADLDGSGTTDIIYLGKNKFSGWINLNGNAFSKTAFEIDAFPDVHKQANITVTDLLGNGVSCIVWSGNLPKDSYSPLRYVDLMNSKKPHLMIGYKNNLGKEVSFQYAPSTKFYIEDKIAGNPWVTKLHFPVHCIASTEVRDKVSGYRFVTSYKYHHGYYDHPEKEFRGFGMVEQTDAEHFENWEKGSAANVLEKELHQQPVVLKTWFHTGAFLRREKILHQFEHEYWYNEIERKGFPVTQHEISLPDARIIPANGISTTVIDNLSAGEWQEALRACRSMTLRSEIFAHDAPLTDPTTAEIKRQLTPYSVAAHNCVIELLQPKGKNKYAIFVVKENEQVTYGYERNTDDPRITHHLNIKMDEYANILESVSVVYPRLMPDPSLPAQTREEQDKTVIVYTESKLTNDVSGNDIYRLRLPAEVKNYELKGVDKTDEYYRLSDFSNILAAANEVAYHDIDALPAPGTSQKRLIEHTRTIYTQDDLSGPLSLLELQSMALPFENYQLAYTPALLENIFGPINIAGSKINDALMIEGRFCHTKDENGIEDHNWWTRSGKILFIEGAETVLHAQDRFYVPVLYVDGYGAKTKIKYYSDYFLFPEEIEDELKNKTRVDKFNFRTISPQRMRDANNNLTEAIADELGLVKATAIMGKDSNNDGIGEEADDLTGFTETTEAAELTLINDFFNASGSVELIAAGKNLCQHATSRFVYDFDTYKNTGKPAVVATIAREEHFKKKNDSPVQLSFEYANGLGQIAMKKVQAEPGAARMININPDDTYTIINVDTDTLNPKQLRWIGDGRTVLNNKGNAVKQYEPYFSVTHEYEELKELVETGVTPVMYYDALDRLVKTKMPDATFSRIDFDSWKQTIADPNDTILDSPWYTNRTNRLIDAALIAAGKDPVKEKTAADKAARHANTPSVLHFDTLGRPVLLREHNRNMVTSADEFRNTKIKQDAEGNLRSITDAREIAENANKGNTVMKYKYDMLGNLVYQQSMDTGQRWLLFNMLSNPLRTWDERNFEFQYFYDTIHRPLQTRVIGGDGDVPFDNIVDRLIYGESLLLPDRTNEAALQAINILGKPIKHFDTGGVVLTPEYDFKKQPTITTRKLFKNYKSVANWTDGNLIFELENDEFGITTETDALGRMTKQVAPDGSIITAAYNGTGLPESQTVVHTNPVLTDTYIENIDYNEKGQRNKITYGNGVNSRFYYDKETFRLQRVETRRQNNDLLQDLYYTFDPIGNITDVTDKNIPVVFFNNQRIEGAGYTYDALYQLVEAEGRENDVGLAFDNKDNWKDSSFILELNPGDPVALRSYTQFYKYDEVGNIKQLRHQSTGNNWTRDYEYEKQNNRLQSTQVGAQPYNYTYHAQHGFITTMPHLDEMGWSFKEQLVKTIRQRVNPGNGTAETTYYQYDGQGQRIRKITENSALPAAVPTKKDERIYIAGYETYRTYQANAINFERESLSIVDEAHRFVIIETVKQNANAGAAVADRAGFRLTRYQFHNHLGSSTLELDATAQVISYEEYHPFGTTAYQAYDPVIKTAGKRFRYIGMERDDETGLEYHSARYYLPWLGRWLNADPIGMGDGINVYAYCRNNPVGRADTNGLQEGYSELGTRTYETREAARERLTELEAAEATRRESHPNAARRYYTVERDDADHHVFRIRIQTQRLFIVTYGERGLRHNTGDNARLAAETHGREIEANRFPGAPHFRPGIDVVRVVAIHTVHDIVTAIAPGDVAYLAYFGHAGVAPGRGDIVGSDAVPGRPATRGHRAVPPRPAVEGTPVPERHGPGALWIGSGTGRGANLTSRGHASDRPVTDLDRGKFTSDAQIRLFGCRAGLGHPPIAQQLADHLHLDVYAYTSRGGSLFTTDPRLGHAQRDFRTSDSGVTIPAGARHVWLVPIGSPRGWSLFTRGAAPSRVP
jgi:RHS repeat-associated protein